MIHEDDFRAGNGRLSLVGRRSDGFDLDLDLELELASASASACSGHAQLGLALIMTDQPKPRASVFALLTGKDLEPTWLARH